MTFALHGIPVSGGIAIGHAHLVSHATLEAAHYLVPAGQIEAEAARFDAAVESVRSELTRLRATVPATAPAEFVGFIDVHLMILNDAMLSAEPRAIIESEQCNAEWALKVQMDALLAQFDSLAPCSPAHP
jgi:phosphotransferase system enzyme I (PtsI)